MSDNRGIAELSSEFIQEKIWTATNNRKAAFVLHDFESYDISFKSECGKIEEKVIIDSGIGQELCKEKWRNRDQMYACNLLVWIFENIQPCTIIVITIQNFFKLRKICNPKRDDIIGNFFFPSDGEQFPAVLHLNGAVPLIQDAR